MTRKYGNDTMYSGTPCDECGGPTLTMPSGSIWCSSEDGHKYPGGHFVLRVAFERAPGHQATARRRDPITTAHENTRRKAGLAPRKAAASVRKDDGFNVGMDAFIGEDAK